MISMPFSLLSVLPKDFFKLRSSSLTLASFHASLPSFTITAVAPIATSAVFLRPPKMPLALMPTAPMPTSFTVSAWRPTNLVALLTQPENIVFLLTRAKESVMSFKCLSSTSTLIPPLIFSTVPLYSIVIFSRIYSKILSLLCFKLN